MTAAPAAWVALVAVAAAATLIAATACGGGAGDGESAGRNADAPAEVTGVITQISRSDGRIEEFTVEGGGETHLVAIDPAIDYGFDLEHLEEHRAMKLPVRCVVEQRDDRLVATAILDA